jgi:hypothetical protein
MAWQHRVVGVELKEVSVDGKLYSQWVAESGDGRFEGWKDILANESANGWELVAVSESDTHRSNYVSWTAGYRLFFKKPA